ncbi:hypothetical protein DL95DRAFT_397208 [Leptodontidium sp. 2 PMI_412]|nr:hypothetical protein DL95DRAFT_397208 [Leptodontidium sp. 2 PMI_412]
MRQSQVFQRSVAILALATPALSCVQFSLNHVTAGTIFGTCSNNYVTNAGLTDNGGQVCSLTNRGGGVCGDIVLSCIGGYSAVMSNSRVVSYSYPGFSGSFQTNINRVGDFTYYTANVWGC